MLKGKKVIVFGERDDISGTTVSNCLKAAGADIIYEDTACFV
jgi:glycine/sarcosine/betaine reductase complex component A